MQETGKYLPFYSCISTSGRHVTDFLPENMFKLFLHEYLHYLQNYGTIAGLQESYITLLRLYRIQEMENIEIPLFLSDIDIDGQVLKYKHSLGNKLTPFVGIKSIEISCNQELDLQICEINQIDNSSFGFGLIHIQEGMAKILEDLIFDEENDLPINPYSTVLEVVKFEYDYLLQDKILVFALCEFCLNSDCETTIYFVHLLREMKRNKFEPTNTEEVFRFCQHTINGDFTKTYTNLGNTISKYSSKLLEGFTEFQEYIEITHEKFAREKVDNLFFMTNWLEDYLIDKSNDKFNILINKYNFPVFIDGYVYEKNETSEDFYVTKGQSENLLALLPYYDIYNYLISGNSQSCSLFHLCNNKHKNNTCEHNVEYKLHEKDLECPYTVVWRKRLELDNKLGN